MTCCQYSEDFLGILMPDSLVCSSNFSPLRIPNDPKTGHQITSTSKGLAEWCEAHRWGGVKCFICGFFGVLWWAYVQGTSTYMVNEKRYTALIHLTHMFQYSVAVCIFTKRHKVCKCCDVKLKKVWTPWLVGWRLNMRLGRGYGAKVCVNKSPWPCNDWSR